MIQNTSILNKSETTTASGITYKREYGNLYIVGTPTNVTYIAAKGSVEKYEIDHTYMIIGSKGRGIYLYQEKASSGTIPRDTGNGVIFKSNVNSTSLQLFTEVRNDVAPYEKNDILTPQILDITSVAEYVSTALGYVRDLGYESTQVVPYFPPSKNGTLIAHDGKLYYKKV